MIAAMTANRIIGRDNKIPWNIPGEQKRFRTLTLGKPVILGRKTYESIGKALPGRVNIVVTNNGEYRPPDCQTVISLESALELCRDYEEVFIGGGEQLYRLALPITAIIYLTVIHQEFVCDTFFPDLPMDEFTTENSQYVEAEIPYTYFTDVRKENIWRPVDESAKSGPVSAYTKK